MGDSEEAAEALHWVDDEELCGAGALIRSRQLAQKALLSPVPFPPAPQTEKPPGPCPGTY